MSTAPGVVVMSITLEKIAEKHLGAKKLSGTRREYRSTVTKWLTWAKESTSIGWRGTRFGISSKEVHDKSNNDGGSDVGRTASKACENLWAIMSWTGEQDEVE